MIDYSVRGEGAALVLIHGLFGTRENLGGIARQLSEHYTVYAIDLPNHGRSAKLNPATLRTMADVVALWMDEVGLLKAHVFGHSLGGKTAMELGLCYPEKVQSLIVADISPVTYRNRHEGVFTGLRAIPLEQIRSRVDADKILQKSVPELAVRSFLLKNLQKNPNGDFQWRMQLALIDESYHDLIQQNCEAVFDKPSLFLKAEYSDYITAEHKAPILARFPQAEFKMVANTGHWLHAEKPDLISRLVRRFLSQ